MCFSFLPFLVLTTEPDLTCVMTQVQVMRGRSEVTDQGCDLMKPWVSGLTSVAETPDQDEYIYTRFTSAGVTGLTAMASGYFHHHFQNLNLVTNGSVQLNGEKLAARPRPKIFIHLPEKNTFSRTP